jgi:plasmid replication initiation protein
LAYPGDRLPGTFDQDVYVEIVRRFFEAGSPGDGGVSFTLHSFLRSMGRRADGRTYMQLRTSLARLEHTVLESSAAYFNAATSEALTGSFSVLSAVAIQRKRSADLNQLTLFPALSAEPGEARVVLAPFIRGNLSAGHVTMLDTAAYFSLQSAVARRLYRLVETVRAASDNPVWEVSVAELARVLPLAQKYPSHLLRVLRPAHEMLIASGLISAVASRPIRDRWVLEYTIAAPARR